MSRILILIFLFIFSVSAISQEKWELRKNENGITVYTRNLDKENIVEFKASTVINANINDVFDFIKNTDKNPEWNPQINYAQNIDSQDNVYYSYQQIKMPIGFSDRDVVIKNEIQKNKPGIIKIVMNACPKKCVTKKNFIRIENAKGFWYFKYIDKNKTYVMYQFYSDPKGKLPIWLVNLFIVDSPYKTLLNLKKILEK